MRNPDPSPEFLSLADAASELGVPLRTLQYQAMTGKVATIRGGSGKTSAYLMTREEVDRLKAGTGERAAS